MEVVGREPGGAGGDVVMYPKSEPPSSRHDELPLITGRGLEGVAGDPHQYYLRACSSDKASAAAYGESF